MGTGIRVVWSLPFSFELSRKVETNQAHNGYTQSVVEPNSTVNGIDNLEKHQQFPCLVFFIYIYILSVSHCLTSTIPEQFEGATMGSGQYKF